ncbi:MAG TPA: hypothetical protein PKA88_24600, partial [Polyangiaceae bacterium]|nr:hypothetical protein [Polyangiaceae bacterium]
MKRLIRLFGLVAFPSACSSESKSERTPAETSGAGRTARVHWVWAAVFFGAVTTAPRTSAGAGWDPEDRRPARVAAEVGGGAAATALGGVIGGFIGAQTCDSNSSNNPIVGMM